MDAKNFLEEKGIHPTEPIWWYGEDDILTLESLMEEYAMKKFTYLIERQIKKPQ